MKNRIIILLCLFLAVNSLTVSYGQKSGKKIKITGFVQDAATTPVADAIIMVDGEKTGFITDSKGFYKIKVSPDSKKIGVFTTTNGTLEAEINGRSKIDFTFAGIIPYKESETGEDPVDIGYGKVKEKDVVGSVGKIDGKKSKYAGYNNIYECIRGQVPGVEVRGTSIIIRGVSTINGSTDPLLVVDGAPVNSIDNILPQQVRSIEVLKGPSAAIYGSRGSNGVILIHLLKGYDK
jgi:TonB-dependent SusC/RagA subfamily outer membrane receptor